MLALNELFDQPLSAAKLHELAAALGSDIPFFLQNKPALATGRGEKIQPLEPFPALRGKAFLLIHPGFGISTPWAYQNLARFPDALNGLAGRAKNLISLQSGAIWPAGADGFYNSLEAPALDKYPVLALYQEFLRSQGALAALMSGSGSTTFAIVENVDAGKALAEKFKSTVRTKLLDGGGAGLIVGRDVPPASPSANFKFRTAHATPRLFFEFRQRKLRHFLRRRNFEHHRRQPVNQSRDSRRHEYRADFQRDGLLPS